MIDIGIIAGSTRPNRRSQLVASWVKDRADSYSASSPQPVQFHVLDLAAYELPLLDEPAPAAIGSYQNSHTHRWAEAIDALDGFVFVTPEYNHGAPAALKNAIDYLFLEWNDKAAGFVSYGLQGGIRAAEQLRLSLAEVKLACVRSQVALHLFTDFDFPDITDAGSLKPAEFHGPILERMLGEIVDWTMALHSLRHRRISTAAAK